jgi:uncharacterized protein (TIGR03067 family)
MKPAISVFALALALFQAPNAEDAAKKDLAAMQGTWILTALEADGKDAPPAKLEGTVLKIEGDLYLLKTKSASHQVRLKLNATKSPKHLDMTFLDGANKDKTLEGIYEVKDGTLRIARGLTPDQRRPEQFATWPNTSYFVMTWSKKE